jgi:hypothetical protein
LAEFANQGLLLAEVEPAINSWIVTWDEDPRHIVWQMSTAEILDTLVTGSARISGTEQNYGGG